MTESLTAAISLIEVAALFRAARVMDRSSQISGMGIDVGRVRWDGASDRSDGDQQDDLILAAIPCWHGLAGVAVPLFSACSR